MAAPLRFERSVLVPGTMPEALWPFVADTDRLNRAVGLPPPFYTAIPCSEGGSRTIAEYRLGPLSLAKWDEAPFQWEYPRTYWVERAYHWGPIRTFRGGADLTPTASGATTVRTWAEIVPRGPLGYALVRFAVGPRGVAAAARQCELFARYLRGELEDPFPQLRRGHGWTWLADRLFRARPPVAGVAPGQAASNASGVPPAEPDTPPAPARTLQANPASPAAADPAPHSPLASRAAAPEPGVWTTLARLTGDSTLVERLRLHLDRAPDPEVLKMRPFALADRWQAPREAALVLCLRATTLGQLVMTWEVLCPHCRAPKASYAALAQVQPRAFCPSCNVTFEADPGENVEVRFTVDPAVRQASATAFCAAGPMTTPHRPAQTVIPGGGTGVLAARLEPGTYDVYSPQSGRGATLHVTPSAESVPLLGSEAGPAPGGPALTLMLTEEELAPASATVSEGDVAIQVFNGRHVTALVAIEASESAGTAATAALVSQLPEFRDLFSTEILAPGIPVAIQRLSFLFTDIAGSTALYERAGQAQAFRLVQEHFKILFAAVAAQGGTVVKTVGDAVMAVFPTGLAAVDAALAIQGEIRNLDARGLLDPGTMVKIGVHQGACVAATANERADYFGTTVNIAARVEQCCRGGQINLTETLFELPSVRARLEERGADVQMDRVELRGISQPVVIYRVEPLPAGVSGSRSRAIG